MTDREGRSWRGCKGGEDGPLEFELGAKCGYEATFDYSSDGA